MKSLKAFGIVGRGMICKNKGNHKTLRASEKKKSLKAFGIVI